MTNRHKLEHSWCNDVPIIWLLLREINCVAGILFLRVKFDDLRQPQRHRDKERGAIRKKQFDRPLDLFVSEVFLDSDKHLILPFIKHRLKQFSLYLRYHEHEILIEAYIRAIKTIEMGKVINNLPAWFKSTAYHIVKEYSKHEKSQRDKAQKCANFTDLTTQIEIDNYINESNLKILKEWLKNLEHRERLIFWLRIVEGWSWKEIGDYLNN